MPAVGILGPRQCGKSTLAKQLQPDHFFDLKNPRDLAKLQQPQLALEHLTGLIVIDEIQRKPELFPLLRYLIDTKKQQTFLLLGSASKQVVSGSAESLAGRISYIFMEGLNLDEVGSKHLYQLWIQGGFPASYLSDGRISYRWRQDFITTFLEQDIPQLGIQVPSATLRRFWTMISHYHGQTVNYSELAASLGVSDKTTKHYLDILASTFMVRLVQPWFVNLKKTLG